MDITNTFAIQLTFQIIIHAIPKLLHFTGKVNLQFLDSPGASSRSQNNIFGCVDNKQRPCSPATDI